MRAIVLSAVLASLAASSIAPAQDLASTCHASSSYDLTLTPRALLFDRADPPPRRIELRDGSLVIDGAAVHLHAEDTDRLALFEQELRALAPRVRRVGASGVDLATQAIRAEAATLDPSADTQAELDRRLATHAAELKQRIGTSTSTHDWQGAAFDRYTDAVAADIVPLLAADLGTQAVAAALGGDLEAAASLRDRAANLADGFPARIQRRLQALRPQIEKLCPAIAHLYELQRDVRGSNQRPLGLLQMEPK